MEQDINDLLKTLIVEKDLEIRNLNIANQNLANQNGELQKRIQELQDRLLKLQSQTAPAPVEEIQSKK